MALTKIGKEGITGISNSANATAITISANEEVNMPLQPAFLAGPSADITNAANGAVITLGTEIFDVGGNVASNNFVAPVTGKYFLSFNVRMQQVDDGTSYLYIRILTSNREYYYIFAPNVFDQDADFWSVSQSVLADMDANDSAALTFHFVNGNQSVDIRDITNGTYFSGALIC